MRTLPLQAFSQAVLDASGNGSTSIGPLSGNETWAAGFNVAVHVSTNNNEAICKVYTGGSLDPQWFSDATTWGSTGDSTTNTRPLAVGQQVFASWTGGDPGATGYLVVTGTKEVP